MTVNRHFAFPAAVLALGLAACGNGESAVQTRERSTGDAAVALTAAHDATTEPKEAALAAARPALTANRTETVDAKIERLFARNGADFGARSAEDYLARVDAFTKRPPAGTDRIERPNGDVLLYQAATNTFAVVSRDGVPKTMFKPRDGAAYWAEQKSAAPEFGRSRRDASPE